MLEFCLLYVRNHLFLFLHIFFQLKRRIECPALLKIVERARGVPLFDRHVAQVVQRGYMDGERLLRPARVVVSAGDNVDAQ